MLRVEDFIEEPVQPTYLYPVRMSLQDTRHCRLLSPRKQHVRGRCHQCAGANRMSYFIRKAPHDPTSIVDDVNQPLQLLTLRCRRPFFANLIFFFPFFVTDGVACDSRCFLFGVTTLLFLPGSFVRFGREPVMGGSHRKNATGTVHQYFDVMKYWLRPFIAD